MQLLLSSACFPPVTWFWEIVQAQRLLIEKQDHFVKQTYRNRFCIAGSNGLQTLVIPVVHGKGKKIAMNDVRISNEFNWRHNHRSAIQSAYGKSPFFDFYKDKLFPFYEKKSEFLFDFNLETLILILEMLKIVPEINFTEEYQEKVSGNVVDFRNFVNHKSDHLNNKMNSFRIKYVQVFSDKFEFIPNLSILDLLFCEGPNSVEVLKRSNFIPG